SGVKVDVEFDFGAVSLCDHEDDGTIGGNVATSLYKGKYYQVQVYTDDDDDMIINTTDDWDIGDRVGINVNKDRVKLSAILNDEDESNKEIDMFSKKVEQETLEIEKNN
ncbi:MAG: hypothetical protein LBU60_03745, partial [Clostridiales bacterium]|nr:hypothetical protein [Clostridiales bacterium]